MPIVELLDKAGLRKGAEPGLIFAAGSCGTDMVKRLMARGVSVRAEYNGTNAMMRATESGCVDTVRFMLANGADVNMKTPDGTTPLIAAAGAGHTAMVQLLLESGADLEARNDDGETAWLVAGLAKHMDIVDLFRKAREKR
jgi:ankyrin repeat protein